MSVSIRIGPAYREFSGGRETISVEGRTVRACLDSLAAMFPVFRDLLFDGQGALASIIIHKGEVMVRSRLDEPVEEASEIDLLPMVSGG
jgi:molybdopterin converting factor small subunit